MSEHPLDGDRPEFEPKPGDEVPDTELPEEEGEGEGEGEEEQDDPGSAPESGDKDPV